MSVSVIPDPDGAWLAVVAGETVLVIEAAASAGLDALSRAVHSDDATRAVLAVLVAGGLDKLPDFALISRPGDATTVRVVIRGQVDVESNGRRLSGTDVETWTEQFLPADDEIVVSTPAVGRPPVLPLADGAAWAAQVVIRQKSGLVAEPEPSARSGARPPRPAPRVEPKVPTRSPVASSPIDEHTIAEPQEDQFGYDHLFEATVVRSVEDAAVRPDTPADEAGPVPASPASPATATEPSEVVGQADHENDDHENDDDDDGDHDGLTVFSGQLGKLNRVAPDPSEIPAAAAHAVFWVRMPSGTREQLTGELLVGRAPTARVGEGALPRLVSLPGDLDISRTHVKFALQGDTVVVTDLHSRNGTTVVLPGKSPQLLRAGESTTVIADTVVDLGGGTTMTLEQDPS